MLVKYNSALTVREVMKEDSVLIRNVFTGRSFEVKGAGGRTGRGSHKEGSVYLLFGKVGEV